MTDYKICAHRGFNTVAPENSLEAMALAVASGADEIELDLWSSKDGVIFVNHDPTVDRTSNGQGYIYSMTYDQLKELDAGSWFSDKFKGLELATFEEVLSLLANKVTMNLHIKSIPSIEKASQIKTGSDYRCKRYSDLFGVQYDLLLGREIEAENIQPYDLGTLETIVDLIYKYNCQDTVYIAGAKDVLYSALKIAPEINRCSLEGKFDGLILDYALYFECSCLQFIKGYFDYDLIDKAHENNIICNLFWSDNVTEAKKFIQRGIDVVLTNDYLNLASSLKDEFKQ